MALLKYLLTRNPMVKKPMMIVARTGAEVGVPIVLLRNRRTRKEKEPEGVCSSFVRSFTGK